MPALQNLAVVDRETTPVTHTFVPRDVKDGTGLLVRNTGVPVGEEKLTVSMRKVGSKFRGKLTFSVPVVQNETINGVVSPKVVRTGHATVEFTFDDTSSTQERTNLQGMVASSLGADKPLIFNTIVGLEGVY